MIWRIVMASFFNYKCIECNLESSVTEEDSAIFAGAIRTGYCVHCEDFDQPVLEDDSFFLEAALTLDQRKKFICSTHKNTPLVGWFKGQRCPRCGGTFSAVNNDFGINVD